jgi:hypothetical protein
MGFRFRAVCALGSAWFGATALAVGGQVFSSGSARVTLLELYTSEGCSSCPPAEKAFAQWLDDPRLWKEVVPVSFHVTYFDTSDWRDRFGAKMFTERQYQHARSWPEETVYTPCFVENGIERRRRESAPAPSRVGVLSAARVGEQRWQIRFEPTAGRPKERFDAYVALVGTGLSSNVRGGENSGRKLEHEFVALTLQSAELKRDGHGALTAEIDLPATNIAAKRYGLAVWVSPHDQIAPLQATGGWLDEVR